MKSWKQIALCLLIAAAAIGGWYAYKNKNDVAKTAATSEETPKTEANVQRRLLSLKRRVKKRSTTV